MLQVVKKDESQSRLVIVTLESTDIEALNSMAAKELAIKEAHVYNAGIDAMPCQPYGVDADGKEIEDPYAPGVKAVTWRKDYRVLQGL